MRFFHIADTHLGAAPDAGFPWSEERKQEIWESFRSVIQKADSEEVDLLLIAGDLFHRQPLMRELKELNYLFSTLKKTKVVFVIGNHDYLKADSYYHDFAWNENVTCLMDEDQESIVFPELDTEVYGLSYHTRERKEPAFDKMEPAKDAKCSILLAHGGDEKHIPINQKKLLLSGFDYIALGHIHKPQIIEKNRMAYAGALEPLDKNDTGIHGFISGEYKDGVMTTTFVPWACREYLDIEVTTAECPTDLAFQETIRMRMNAKGVENIYRITIRGFRDPDILYDVNHCRQYGNVSEVRDESEPDYDFEKLEKAHTKDIAGRYIRSLYHEDMSETEKKALYIGVQALLEMRG